MISIAQTALFAAALVSFLLMCYYAFQGFMIRRTIGPRGFLAASSLGCLIFIAAELTLGSADDPALLLQLFRLQMAGGLIAAASWFVTVYLMLFPQKRIPLFGIVVTASSLVLTPTPLLQTLPVKNHLLMIAGIDFSFRTGTPQAGLLVAAVFITAAYALGLYRSFTSENGYKKKTLGFIVFLPGIVAAVHGAVYMTSAYYIHAVTITTFVLLNFMALVLLFDDKRLYTELHSMYTQLQQELHEQHELIDDLNDELLNTSIYDSVTGLYNRKELYDRMTSEMSRALRHNRELMLVYIDLDNFGYYNNEYGHYAGDFILKEFGEILMNITRKADCVARFGSDEFMLLLPETNMNGAVKVLENIWAVLGTRNGFSAGLSEFLQRDIEVPRERYLDFCAGLNCIIGSREGAGQTSIEDLVFQTRTALSAAKRIGPGNYAVYRAKNG
ncbi:MAG: diguanylate cyclase [Spirochaetales bacterium]|nr:diguanylate cyclase [Spirochaetales bacterium]